MVMVVVVAVTVVTVVTVVAVEEVELVVVVAAADVVVAVALIPDRELAMGTRAWPRGPGSVTAAFQQHPPCTTPSLWMGNPGQGGT